MNNNRAEARDALESVKMELFEVQKSCSEYRELIKSTKKEAECYEADLKEEQEKLAEVNDRYDMAQENLVNAM